jgi:hypothetical protein
MDMLITLIYVRHNENKCQNHQVSLLPHRYIQLVCVNIKWNFKKEVREQQIFKKKVVCVSKRHRCVPSCLVSLDCDKGYCQLEILWMCIPVSLNVYTSRWRSDHWLARTSNSQLKFSLVMAGKTAAYFTESQF